ncbi:MAG: hypothetical protein ACRDKI_09495 [Solirubrobacterales bacterium]
MTHVTDLKDRVKETDLQLKSKIEHGIDEPKETVDDAVKKVREVMHSRRIADGHGPEKP